MGEVVTMTRTELMALRETWRVACVTLGPDSAEAQEAKAIFIAYDDRWSGASRGYGGRRGEIDEVRAARNPDPASAEGEVG